MAYITKRKALDVSSKAQIIGLADRGTKFSEIASQFGVDRSTIGKAVKKRDKILAASHSSSVSSESKRLRTSATEGLDSALLKWFSFVWSRNIPLSGPFVAQKGNV